MRKPSSVRRCQGCTAVALVHNGSDTTSSRPSRRLVYPYRGPVYFGLVPVRHITQRLLAACRVSGELGRPNGASASWTRTASTPGLSRITRPDRLLPAGAISSAGVTGTLRPRAVVIMVAAAWMALWLVVIGAHNATPNGLLHAEPRAPYPPHALVTSLGTEFAVNADHPHIGKGSPSIHHEPFMTAVLPRSATNGLVALGVVAAVVAVAARLARLAAPAGRGPPVAPAAFFAGPDLLTRLCLSRR